MADLEAFRHDIREWLENHAPKALMGHSIRDDSFWGGRNPELSHPDSKRWCDMCAERGLTTPAWPVEYGGGGLSREEERIWHEELRRLSLPMPLTGFGLSMIGPTLLQFGTEEQKQNHLTKIIRGEIRWCQGYSEPNTGSDLASLQTAAILEDDEYVINGQKIWTSYGDKADWMFALVRTNTNVKKQQGITFILLDMDQPGVTARPIQLISGSSPFCEVFFTDARAKARNAIGDVNDGWTVAKALLGHERNMIGSLFGGSRQANKSGKTDTAPKDPLAEMAKTYVGEHAGQLSDPVLRDRIAQIGMDQMCFQLTVQRNADNIKAGHRPGPESSLFKIYGTELNQRREELMLSIRGPQSVGWEGEGFDDDELTQTRAWLRSRGNSIEGGTSEIQLNIIAKRVLQLPD